MAKKAKPEVKNRFFIPRDGKYVNVEDLPQEEQDLIRKNFSEQLADAMMEGLGYTRVTPSGKKTIKASGRYSRGRIGILFL